LNVQLLIFVFADSQVRMIRLTNQQNFSWWNV